MLRDFYVNIQKGSLTRPFDLYVWSDNETRITCLCPPSYYGSQCEYQNQRISLSIQFRALSNSFRRLKKMLLFVNVKKNGREYFVL